MDIRIHVNGMFKAMLLIIKKVPKCNVQLIKQHFLKSFGIDENM